MGYACSVCEAGVARAILILRFKRNDIALDTADVFCMLANCQGSGVLRYECAAWLGLCFMFSTVARNQQQHGVERILLMKASRYQQPTSYLVELEIWNQEW